MAREFEQLPDGVALENKHVQQLLMSWLGLEGDGTDAQLAGVSIRQTSVNDDALYAVDARNRGVDGLHYRATHSSGSPELFKVTDDGTFASIAGSPATQPFVFPGMIVLWHGVAGDQPAGWAICDGTNGTPDLRDRFVVGAGSTYALNATGGAAAFDNAHTHTGPSHAHGAATASGGGGDTFAGGGGDTFDGGGFTTSTPVPGTRSVTDDGSVQVNVSDIDHEHTEADHIHGMPTHDHSLATHTHTISADGTGATGSGGSATQATLPPYAALHFIKRIAA